MGIKPQRTQRAQSNFLKSFDKSMLPLPSEVILLPVVDHHFIQLLILYAVLSAFCQLDVW